MKLLLIDHLDSFTYNLAAALQGLGATVEVVRSNQELRVPSGVAGIVLSPGPGRPAEYPQTLQFLAGLPATLPVLGVCLGMQCLNEWSGGTTIVAPTLLHGKTSPITHVGRGLFSELTSPCMVARYHSLACDVRSPEWEITAQTEDGVAMAMQHRSRPWCGVQFHPESFLTPDGLQMLKNWINAKSTP